MKEEDLFAIADAIKGLDAMNSASLFPITSLLYCAVFTGFFSPAAFSQSLRLFSEESAFPAFDTMLEKVKNQKDALLLFSAGIWGTTYGRLTTSSVLHDVLSLP